MIAAAPDSMSALVAVEEAETAVRGPMETCPACKISLAVPAAIAAANAGERDQAEGYAQTAQMLADVVLRQRGWHAAVDEVKGHVALAGGEIETAAGLFRKAAKRFHESGQPLDADRCLTLAATAA